MSGVSWSQPSRIAQPRVNTVRYKFRPAKAERPKATEVMVIASMSLNYFKLSLGKVKRVYIFII
jgi:hypothetical protein